MKVDPKNGRAQAVFVKEKVPSAARCASARLARTQANDDAK